MVGPIAFSFSRNRFSRELKIAFEHNLQNSFVILFRKIFLFYTPFIINCLIAIYLLIKVNANCQHG